LFIKSKAKKFKREVSVTAKSRVYFASDNKGMGGDQEDPILGPGVTDTDTTV
jgi:hypothetical protein